MNRLPHRAFTLVEIMLVLALLALASAVLLPAAGALFGRTAPAHPEDVMADLMQEVRREAVLSGRTVSLRFDVTAQQFVWDGANGGTLTPPGDRFSVDFLRSGDASAVLIGGRLVENNTRPALKFFADGTCEPARVQWRLAAGSSRVFTIDPWTCAPGLEARP